MAKAELRKRNRGRGDYPIGSALADVVDRFRELAGLHLNAPDQALILFAHGDGRKRPGAAQVRETVAGLQRHGPERLQEASVIEGGTQGTQEGPRSRHTPTSEQQDPIQSPSTAPGPPPQEPAPQAPGSEGADICANNCPHNCQSLSIDQEVVCLDCGEVLRVAGKQEKSRPAQINIRSPLFEDVEKVEFIEQGRIQLERIAFREEIEEDEILF